MHTESECVGCTTHCYPEQDLVDNILRVHMQSPGGLWAKVTLSYICCVTYAHYARVADCADAMSS